VKDLVCGNTVPLVLYTDLRCCFLKLALQFLKTLSCILALPGKSKSASMFKLLNYLY